MQNHNTQTSLLMVADPITQKSLQFWQRSYLQDLLKSKLLLLCRYHNVLSHMTKGSYKVATTTAIF